MKKLLLCLTLVACGFAVQATDTKSPKNQVAPAKATTTSAAAAKSDCCDAKKDAAACTSCCADGKAQTRMETKRQTLLSPKHAADKRA